MKKIIPFIIALLSMAMFSSCMLEEEKTFDESMLYGKWNSGTLYYKYLTDHTGATWDVADDILEDEATRFTWTLVSDELTHIYVTEVSEQSTRASIPKVYTVITLTENTLMYEDDYGNLYTFKKII